MPARLRRPVEASLRSNREASRATLAVTRLHQRAKRDEDTSIGSKPCELKELRDPDVLAAMTPRQLSLVAWSLGKLRDLGSDLGCAREDLLSLVASRASDMDAQGLSMTMWSFASLKVQSHVRVVVGHALAAMSQMSAQGVSNTLWACASLREDQEPLLQLLAEADAPILSKLSTCSTQAAANVIWATARLSGAWAMQRMAAQVAQARAPELRAEEAAAVLWALAVTAPVVPKAAFKGRKERLSVLSVVSEHALRQLHPKSLAASVWAFATLAETGPFWWLGCTKLLRCTHVTRESVTLLLCFASRMHDVPASLALLPSLPLAPHSPFPHHPSSPSLSHRGPDLQQQRRLPSAQGAFPLRSLPTLAGLSQQSCTRSRWHKGCGPTSALLFSVCVSSRRPNSQLCRGPWLLLVSCVLGGRNSSLK